MDRPELLVGERQYRESDKAIIACNDFLRMGVGRKLVLLVERYKNSLEETTPTKKRFTIEKWSKEFHWFERAAAYDKRLEDEKNARAREIMESGLALDFERVSELKDLAIFLKRQIYTTAPAADQAGSEGIEYPYVWLRDVKQIGAGESAEKVEIFRFNSAIIEQLRGLLDDIARETGGRITKHEMSGPAGGPIAISDEQHNRAISTLAAALGTLIPGSGAGQKDGLDSTE